MYALTKKAIKGTAIEPVAKKFAREIRQRRRPRLNRLNRLYDRQTIEIMSRVLADDSNCIDAGAHKGSILKEIMKIAPNGHHYAFEPIPKLASELKNNFPTVNIYELALSDQPGKCTFYHRLNSPGISSLDLNTSYDSSDQVQAISVKTDKLDSIIPDEHNIDFIKIDVEGAQLKLLSGAFDLIKRNKPYIVFEHGRNRTSDSDQIYKLLVDQCSLKISLLGDWLHNKKPLALNQFTRQVETNWYRKQEINWYFLAHP